MKRTLGAGFTFVLVLNARDVEGGAKATQADGTKAAAVIAIVESFMIVSVEFL